MPSTNEERWFWEKDSENEKSCWEGEFFLESNAGAASGVLGVGVLRLRGIFALRATMLLRSG